MSLRSTESGKRRSLLFQEKEERKGKKLEINSKILLVIGVIVAIIILIFFIIPKITISPEEGKKPTKLTKTQILKITGEELITKDFIVRHPKYETKITFLDEKALSSLALESPAIYGDLNAKEIYKVEYKSKDEGIMLLLNPETKKVVKYYRVKEISF